METSGLIKKSAWVAASAALVGGGMVLGFASALLRRNQREAPAAADYGEPARAPAAEKILVRRIDELALAVAGLEQRTKAGPLSHSEAVQEKLDAVSLRVEQLEQRVEQLAGEPSALPPVDQVLAAVENMVAAKISGLDDRITEQVHAIELLRSASAQTDLLLERLISAVDSLAHNAIEKEPAIQEPKIEPEQLAVEPYGDRDYPIA